MKLTSPAFANGGNIPAKYTCDGQDISPPLKISDVPQGTKSLALIMDDPDAPMGTFIHWVMWNIPPDTTEIKEGVAPKCVQGVTDFGRMGYGGPCPPSGTHTYRFELVALDQEISLPEGYDLKQLRRAIERHIITRVVLTGSYRRR